jgi:DNA-binding CsgD family transcriptional regulator
VKEVKKLCLACPKRSVCSEPCPEVEAYISQDEVDPIGEKLIYQPLVYGFEWPKILHPMKPLSKVQYSISILTLLGRSAKEICALLKISSNSFRNEVSRIRSKVAPPIREPAENPLDALIAQETTDPLQRGRQPKIHPPAKPLSRRQLAVGALFLRGKSQDEICKILKININSFYKTMSVVRKKIGIRGRNFSYSKGQEDPDFF